MPDYQKVAKAYNVKSFVINNNAELRKKIKTVLNSVGPTLCEIMISPDQELIPRMGFKKNPDGSSSGIPLEDMAPFLDRKEFKEIMIVKTWDEFKKDKNK